jgi:CRISPR/Cas system-associated protein Csm6
VAKLPSFLQVSKIFLKLSEATLSLALKPPPKIAEPKKINTKANIVTIKKQIMIFFRNEWSRNQRHPLICRAVFLE